MLLPCVCLTDNSTDFQPLITSTDITTEQRVVVPPSVTDSPFVQLEQSSNVSENADVSILEVVSINAEEHVQTDDVTDVATGLGAKQNGPYQPRLPRYPQTKVGRQNRAFTSDWYTTHTWLEYSTQRDTAFCFACRHFRPPSAYADNLFTERGFRNWKYATGKDGALTKHALSHCHLDAMMMWEQYRMSRVSGSVIEQQCTSYKAWIDKNRKYLSRIIDAVIYLTRQGLALRGDDETDDSLNRGNFLELLSLLSSIDPDFDEKCKISPANAKYTSAEVQNELINIAANQIRKNICHEATDAGMIAIMVDDSKDISRKEQMSICIRYTILPSMNVREQFLLLRHMSAVDATSLSEAIMSSLATLELGACIVVAQCYDGASVMSGRVHGVQAQIRKIHKTAIYIHCHAHRLNLVVVDVAREVQLASEFFALVELLYVFLTRQKVHEVFCRLQQERGLVQRELGKLSDTRWACRYHNVLVIKERFGVIVDVLHEVQCLGDAEISVLAKGLELQVESCMFVANLILFCKILSTSYGVSEALQSSTIDICQSVNLITGMITSMSDLRQKPSIWTDTWKEIQALCSSHNIEIQGPHSQRSKRKKTVRESPDMYYTSPSGHRDEVAMEPSEAIRICCFNPVVDRIVSELKRRFSDESLAVISSVSSLICPNSPKFLCFSEAAPMLSLYAESCGISESLLESEMTVALNLLKNNLGETLSTSNMQTILPMLAPSLAFPNLLKCIQLALTLPVTSASCERSFSVMKIIKTCLRNRTGDDRLSDLTVLFAHKDRSLDREKLIDSFAERVDRRMKFC